MTQGSIDFGIVGGGILGMTLAIRLAEAGNSVTVYERGDTLGGLATGAPIGDVTWDRFYHVMLQSDTALLALLDSLGVATDLQWRATGTGLYDDGSLHPVSNAVDYLRLPVLGPLAKVRIGATVLRASRIRDWASLEQMTAEQWLTRWSGPAAYRRFWLPLLRSKLGDRYDEVSAAFIWAIIHRLYAARRAGMKQDLFGYMPGGYSGILTRLESRAVALGVRPLVGVRVLEVAGTEGGASVRTTDDLTVHDRVVVTVPSPIAADLIPGLSASERDAHLGIMYQGIVCASLLLDRPLSDFYVTNITDPAAPFTGVIEMSALVDRVEFGGRSLVYLPKYLPPDDPMFEESNDAIMDRFNAALSAMYPWFESDQIVAHAVARARYVLPLSTVGYSDRLPPMQTSVPGVYVVNSAHIVNGTLNANETVGLANRSVPVVTAVERSGSLR
ncbi:MAG TPA: NAD(P)/FAD-dependent oxidoreductase [Acidimicrobiia bacterium]|nr:NAD(P)/FAD-dependent oxidoreductase [Acidimicrobiia bacterium]